MIIVSKSTYNSFLLNNEDDKPFIYFSSIRQSNQELNAVDVLKDFVTNGFNIVYGNTLYETETHYTFLNKDDIFTPSLLNVKKYCYEESNTSGYKKDPAEKFLNKQHPYQKFYIDKKDSTESLYCFIEEACFHNAIHIVNDKYTFRIRYKKNSLTYDRRLYLNLKNIFDSLLYFQVTPGVYVQRFVRSNDYRLIIDPKKEHMSFIPGIEQLYVGKNGLFQIGANEENILKVYPKVKEYINA